jgi:hypothetical protein
MKPHPVNLILIFCAMVLMTVAVNCGSDVEGVKYPGQEKAIGEGDKGAATVSPEDAESEGEGGPRPGGTMIEFGGGEGEGGQSVAPPVAPHGAQPVARPLQAGSSEEEDDEGEEAAEDEESTGGDEEEAAEEEPAEEDDSGLTHKEKTPAKFKHQLGPGFNFEYLNPDESTVGALNEMIKAIDILTVNEKKYEQAKAYLTEEVEGLSRGDPLFIPEAVPDELRPLIPGEGISGAIDEELRKIFESQVEADLRLIPINIIGIMEQGGSRLAIGTIWYSRSFKVSQGQEIRFWYSGWYVLGITGTLITEDLVVLSLRILQFTGRGFRAVTDYVPRSFHIGIT